MVLRSLQNYGLLPHYTPGNPSSYTLEKKGKPLASLAPSFVLATTTQFSQNPRRRLRVSTFTFGRPCPSPYLSQRACLPPSPSSSKVGLVYFPLWHITLAHAAPSRLLVFLFSFSYEQSALQ